MSFAITSASFTDPDHASSLLSTSFAPVLLEPFAKRSFDFEVAAITLPKVQVYRSRTRAGLRFSSLGHFDGFTFSSMSSGRLSVHVGSDLHSISGGETLVTDAETVDQLIMSEGAGFSGIALSADAIQSALCDRIDHDVERRIVFERNAMSPAVRCSCEAISDILYRGLLEDGHLTDNALALQNLQDALVNLILFGTCHSYAADLRAGTVELPSVVRRAVDYMHAHAHLPITTTEVARDLGIGLRSLQLSFKRWLNTTPHHYLRHIRLKAAREDLILGDDSKIGDVARRWGFLSSGEFSRLYQNAFGERPADTLHRRSLRR